MPSKTRFSSSAVPESYVIARYEKFFGPYGTGKLVPVPFVVNDETVEISLPDFREEVAKGIALLDEIAPDWWQRVDTSLLNLEDTSTCVLGQTYADNPDARPGFDWKVREYFKEHNLQPHEYGFDLTPAAAAFLNFRTKEYVNHLREAKNLPTMVAYDLADAVTKETLSQVWHHLTSYWTQEIMKRRAAQTPVREEESALR